MSERLFVALDHPSLDAALALVERLAGVVTRYKVGLELFLSAGPEAVTELRARGAEVFLDLKLHDIPETVGRAARAAASTGARWLTVHAAGGGAMLRAAVAGARAGDAAAQVLAVTVLTSMDLADLAATGTTVPSVETLVVRRALLSREAGCGGVIASPREARAVRAAVGSEFRIVTPGIRAGAGEGERGDQKRVASAASAIADGADAVVVGRPVRDAADPRAAAVALVDAIEAAVALRSGGGASGVGRAPERA